MVRAFIRMLVQAGNMTTPAGNGGGGGGGRTGWYAYCIGCGGQGGGGGAERSSGGIYRVDGGAGRIFRHGTGGLWWSGILVWQQWQCMYSV